MPLACLAACLAFCPRAAHARAVRVATYNVHVGVGAVGSTEYSNVMAVLERIDADIVAFQELRTADSNNWSTLGTTLGYTNFAFSRYGPFSGSDYIGYWSRFPILSTFNVTSPPGAKELTRFPFRAVVSVPGAAKPLLLWSMHHKASSGTYDTDAFRRAVEAIRIRQDIDAYRAAHPNEDEFVLLGDLNDDVDYSGQPQQFDSIPTVDLPVTYALGADISFPVLYRAFPTDRYADAGGGLRRLQAYQEGTTTQATFSSALFDYIYVSTALVGSAYGPPEAEVYNSVRDAGGGLPKAGVAPPLYASSLASDHLPVFADLHMADLPDGIPDDWRLANFGHIEQRPEDLSGAGDDADGDGVSNVGEYLADTQPTNGDSVLQITGIAPDGDGVNVMWRGGVQARQVIEWLDISLTNSTWTAVATNHPPTPAVDSALLPSSGCRMFRIRAGR